MSKVSPYQKIFMPVCNDAVKVSHAKIALMKKSQEKTQISTHEAR